MLELAEKQAAAQKLADEKEQAERERLELEEQRQQAEEEARKLQEVRITFCSFAFVNAF